jgi:hypothetical protein
MKRRTSLLLTALYCLLFVSAQAQSADKVIEIPFTLLPSGHLLVKGKVGGIEGDFVFDTGAGITAFTKAYFDKLKGSLKEDGGYTGFRATGERLDLDLYIVKEAELAGFKKIMAEVSVIDANFGGLDGIIAMNFFDGRVFTIDYEAKLIRLETTTSIAAAKQGAQLIHIQPEDSRGKSLTVFAYYKINDTLTLQLSMDSGAGKDVFRLNSKYMKQLDVDGNDSTKVKRIQRKSEVNEKFVSSIYLTRLRKLAVADAPQLNTTDFPVQFLDGLIYDGIIWINWLGKQLTFDVANKSLWVRK